MATSPASATSVAAAAVRAAGAALDGRPGSRPCVSTAVVGEAAGRAGWTPGASATAPEGKVTRAGSATFAGTGASGAGACARGAVGATGCPGAGSDDGGLEAGPVVSRI